jgi:predicted PhzF superfamily epimerase YddE/YHI9
MLNLKARNIRFGINEDPVTGSAHCVLAPYWFEKLSQVHGGQYEELVGYQASARGGLLTLRLSSESRAETISSGNVDCEDNSTNRVKLIGHSCTTLTSQILV